MENLLGKFNEQINELLNECHETQTPTVCNLISTKDGREKILELIQIKVLRERLTIGEAIVSIEMEYNINSSDK